MSPDGPGLAFTKMSGGGNDFIILEAAAAAGLGDLASWVVEACRRGLAVGADGVLVLGREAGEISVRHYNADGGRSDLCGNGTRCAARWARLRGWGGDRLRLRTGAGPVTATFPGRQQVRLELGLECRRPEPRRVPLPDGSEVSGAFLEIGIPHFVVPVEDPGRVEVPARGRALREHPAFRPAGTNVSFVAPRPDGSLDVRTYERGVEGETLSCGTGCAAAAVVALERGWSTSPVVCHTRSGVALEVGLRAAEKGYERLSLAGDARLIYEARLSPEAIRSRVGAAPP